MDIDSAVKNYGLLMFSCVIVRCFILMRIDAKEGRSVVIRFFLCWYSFETFFPFFFRKVEERHIKRLKIANALLAIFYLMFFGLMALLYLTQPHPPPIIQP